MKKLISVLTASSLLSGCFDISGPSDSNVAPEKPAPEAYSLTGHAVDGLIVNGDVRVYDYSEGEKGQIIGEGKTDNFGVFDATVQGIKSEEGQYVLSCVVSGSYTEEASGVSIALEDGQELCAVKFFNPSANFSVVINPYSHYAYGLADYLIREKEEAIENAITEANTTFSSVAGFNNLTTVPLDPTDRNNFGKPWDDSMQMGYVISGISQYTLDIAKEMGLSRHTNTFSSIALHQTNFNDINSDGNFDGFGIAQNGVSKIQLGMGTRVFTRNTMNYDIAKSTVNFANSDANKAGVSVETMLSDLERLASSTDSVFAPVPQGEPVPTLDDTAPAITFEFADMQFVSDLINIEGSISDFAGIKSAKISVNGTESALQLDSNGNFTFPYQTSGDGQIEIVVTATDLLNNSDAKGIRLIAANSAPISTLQSDQLVNSTNYSFVSKLSNYEQGISSITVNGITASIDEQGVITANVSLQEGNNDLALTIVDGLNETHTYNYSVAVDLTLPTMEIEYPNPVTNYKVYYKDFNLAEPYLSNLEFSRSGDPLYIDQFHVALNGQALTEENLINDKWSFIKFIPVDPATSGNDFVATPRDEIKVSYQYIQGSTTLSEKPLTPFDFENSEYVLPLSDEFLAVGWDEYEGTQAIVFKLEDNAGMVSTRTFEFKVYNSVPGLTTDLSSYDYLAGNSTINFDSTDFTGVDTVTLEINGQTYTADSVSNPSFAVDLSSLNNGLYEGQVKAYKDGKLVYTTTIDFNVDNTPAALTVTSPEYHNTPDYLLSGSVSDNQSGIDFISVGGSIANYNLFSKTYSSTISGLIEGTYSTEIKAVNNAGLESVISKQFNIDLKKPTVFQHYPSVSNPFNVSYQNNIESSPSDQALGFVNDGSIFFYNDSNISLNGNQATISYLTTNKIPFVKIEVSDPFSNGAETEKPIVNYTLYKNGAEIKQGELVSSLNEHIIPITTEVFGNALKTAKYSDTFNLSVSISDLAGNEEANNYYFKIAYAPSIPLPTDEQDFSLFSSYIDLMAKSNKIVELKKFTITNTNDIPLITDITDSINIEYNHKYKSGKKYAEWVRTEKDVFYLWTKVRTIGIDISTNRRFHECELVQYDDIWAKTNIFSTDLFKIPSGSRTISESGFIDEKILGKVESEPTPYTGTYAIKSDMDEANISYWTVNVVSPDDSTSATAKQYFVVDGEDNSQVVDVCVDVELYNSTGEVLGIGLHEGSTISNRVLLRDQIILQGTVSTYNYANGFPVDQTENLSKIVNEDIPVKISVTHNDNPVAIESGNKFELLPNQTVDVVVSVEVPTIQSRGSDCSFGSTLKYCDIGYDWSTLDEITIDAYANDGNSDVFRTELLLINQLNGNITL